MKMIDIIPETMIAPCKMLTKFQSSRPHRAEIFSSLNFAKEHSPDEWDEAMHKEFACGQCGTYNSVYADGCFACENKIANPFAERNWNII